MLTKQQQEAIAKMGHQYAWSQLIHDRDFHSDIDCLNPKEKLSHFAHHIAKYTPVLVDVNGEVNYRILADMMIISTSMANASRVRITNLWGEVVRGDIYDYCNVKMTQDDAEIKSLRFLARRSADLGKACEALDHLENFNSGKTIKTVVGEIYTFIYNLWTGYLLRPIDELFDLILNRLLYVEMQNPYYLRIKKQQHQAQLGKAIEAYTNLPVRCDALLKKLNATDITTNGYAFFNSSSYQMVMDLPVLTTLEEKGLIMREMSGYYTVKQAGKDYLETII